MLEEMMLSHVSELMKEKLQMATGGDGKIILEIIIEVHRTISRLLALIAKYDMDEETVSIPSIPQWLVANISTQGQS